MQGLWSTHRRAKINLNSASLPSTGSTTPTVLPTNDNDEAVGPVPTVETSAASLPPSAPATPALEEGPGPSEGKPVSTKRKLRSSRVPGAEGSKRAKLSGSISKDYAPPTTRLSDLGGVDQCVEKMLELVAMPLCHPEIYLHTGVQPPRGVLLHGPPGCGKTMLAHAIAGVRPSTFSVKDDLAS